MISGSIDMDTATIKSKISDLYGQFFEDMKIDPETGIVAGTDKRFSGFPYLGAKYAGAPVRILFVALDTGNDEKYDSNTFHSFESRERVFLGGDAAKLDFNPHIGGLYATALYLLKDKMGWEDAWSALWAYRDQYKTAKAIRVASRDLPLDLMAYVAYENRFRFVTVKRGHEKDEKGNEIKDRSGGKDRKWLDMEREKKMLLDEIDAFAPDVVVFQGKVGLWNCGESELKKKYKVITLNHPSCWQRKADRLQYIADNCK